MLFSKDCPLFDTRLTLGMRLLYTSVTWSYITNCFAVPVAVLVPFIALVFGVYPLVLNRDFALAATLYFSATTLVTSYCTNRKHIKPLWFTLVSCHLLWFTFLKAMCSVLIKKINKKKVRRSCSEGSNGVTFMSVCYGTLAARARYKLHAPPSLATASCKSSLCASQACC